MHGQIGDVRGGVQRRGGLDFYYRTRAALIEARRGLGGGLIDYDLHRQRARTERARVRREVFMALGRYVRPLAAIAFFAAAILMGPKQASDCSSCDGPARPFKSMIPNR